MKRIVVLAAAAAALSGCVIVITPDKPVISNFKYQRTYCSSSVEATTTLDFKFNLTGTLSKYEVYWTPPYTPDGGQWASPLDVPSDQRQKVVLTEPSAFVGTGERFQSFVKLTPSGDNTAVVIASAGAQAIVVNPSGRLWIRAVVDANTSGDFVTAGPDDTIDLSGSTNPAVCDPPASNLP